MHGRDEEQLRAIWRGQAVVGAQMTPEQLRSRAARFEVTVRRRNLRDNFSSALVAAACIGAAILQDVSLLVRVSYVLMGVWALFTVYCMHRFGSVLAIPRDATAESCAAFHRRQLERQRDIVLFWPWGVGLVIPGFALFIVGLGLDPDPAKRVSAMVLTGVFLFFYGAVVIYGKGLAGEWQREIDSLRSLQDEADRGQHG